MRRLASCFGFALVVALAASTGFAADEARFAAVSSGLSDDASSVGFDITGEFGKDGGAVTVGEIPSYVDPQEGLVMMVRIIAKAGSRLIEQCEAGEDYPITVHINGATNQTTAGRCREFLKDPCAAGVCTFWMAPQAS